MMTHELLLVLKPACAEQSLLGEGAIFQGVLHVLTPRRFPPEGLRNLVHLHHHFAWKHQCSCTVRLDLV